MKTFGYRKKLLTILLLLFLVALGYGVILPVLPFFTERLAMGEGASQDSITLQIGLLTSVYPFFQMVLAPFWGRWSDRRGRRTLLLMGLLGFILMQVLIGLVTSLWALYAARIIGGIFTSASIPVGYALISDLTTGNRRDMGIALAGTTFSLGVVLGPFIGGVLSRTDLHWEADWGHFLINDYSVPFLFLAGLGLVLVLPVWHWLGKEEDLQNEQAAKVEVSAVQWRVLFNRLFPYLLLSFVYQMVLTLFETVFSIYSKDELAYQPSAIGHGFMVCALVMALLQPVAVSKKTKQLINRRNQLVLGFALFGAGILLLLLVSSLPLVLLFIGLAATGAAFIAPNVTTLVSLEAGPDTGSALGLQKSTDGLGQVIGPIAGSWFFTIDTDLPYLLSGSIVIALALLIAWRKGVAY
ncbi:MAG: MFS transporter [Lewinella sp.]|nr:MFS transporter [Lewinella sp.]